MKKPAINLFPSGIENLSLVNPSSVKTTRNLRLLKKLITCFLFILFATHLQAQIHLPDSPFDFSYWFFYNYVTNNTIPPDTMRPYPLPQGDVCIGGSTNAYNCHAFAWPVMNTIWINDSGNDTINGNYWTRDVNGKFKAPYIYWSSNTGTSHMYDTTDEQHAEIAVCGNSICDFATIGTLKHSAVRITNHNSSNQYIKDHFNKYSKYAGWYISKWGNGPLVIHRLLNDCNECSGAVVFFKKTHDTPNANNLEYKIDGPDRVCASGATFTIPSWGILSATWSITGPLSIVSQNGTSCIIQATGHASGTVNVSYTSVYGSSSDSKSVTGDFGPDDIGSISTSQYDPSSSSPIIVSQNTWVHFYCHPFVYDDLNDLTPPFTTYDSHWATDYSWTCNPSSYGQNPEPHDSRSVLIMFNQPYSYYLTAIASNACGSKRYSQSIYVTPGWYFSLSPNPASSNVTVTMLKGNKSDTDQNITGNDLSESTAQTVATTAPKAQTNIPVTYTVKIVNSFGSLFYSSKKTGDTFTIPVGNLQKGNYLVQISDGKTASSQTLIISR